MCDERLVQRMRKLLLATALLATPAHADNGWNKQRDVCIRAGAQYHRGGEKQNDWLLFCMQQAHWYICEECRANFGKHEACGSIGTDALYQPECWRFPQVPGADGCPVEDCR